MNGTDPLIDCRKVVKCYGEDPALRGVSFTVQRGEVFGCLGPNGAGKTTLVRLLNGVLEPDSGEISVLGMDPSRDGYRVRSRTGVLTENAALYESLTVFENLAFFGELFGLEPDRLKQRIKEVLEVFGLTERARQKAGALSRGLKKRVALARAFLNEPDILFLDEPTANLDPEAARTVVEAIGRLGSWGLCAVFLATHNLAEAQHLCSQVMILKNGSVLAVGTQEQLVDSLGAPPRVLIKLLRAPPDDALSRISALPGVIDPALEGTVISFTFRGESVVSAAVRTLVERGADVVAVTPLRSTLEEVYFRIQQAEGSSELLSPPEAGAEA